MSETRELASHLFSPVMDDSEIREMITHIQFVNSGGNFVVDHGEPVRIRTGSAEAGAHASPEVFKKHPFLDVMGGAELQQLYRDVQYGPNGPWPFIVEFSEPIRLYTEKAKEESSES